MEGSALEERTEEKDNAEAQRSRSFRREDLVAGAGWRVTVTGHGSMVVTNCQ